MVKGLTKRIQLSVSIETHNRCWYAYKKAKQSNPDLKYSDYLISIIKKEVDEQYPF